MSVQDKLWFLMCDSILEGLMGAWEVMNVSIEISMDCYCQLSGWDYQWVKEKVETARKEALEAVNNDLTKIGIVRDLTDYKLMKLKEFMDAVSAPNK